MKEIVLLFLLILTIGCHKPKVGYLITDNALYLPAVMEIRLTLEEEKDAYRMQNIAPWVSPKIQGVIGTPPIYYEIHSVSSPNSDDTVQFKQLLTIRGGGRMEFPLVHNVKPGLYEISIRVFNEDHSQLLNKIFSYEVKP